MLEPAVGMQIGPNVRLTRALGQGGMGTVWVGAHERLATEVAVKIIDPELARRDPTMLARFKREARTAAQIKSPHVVQMLDDGALEDGTPYIIMELLDGENLGELLARQGPLDPARVAKVLEQTAEALDAAHRLDIIHRDLKPENLFLIRSGYDTFVKVLDFGIAKLAGSEAEDITSTLAVMGTPRYMSPEQLISGKNVGPSTDLWALAVIAYKALSGHAPFEGDTLAAVTLAVCTGDYLPVSARKTGLPPALEAFFDKAFQQEPGARYDSAQQLYRAFSQAIAAPVKTATGAATPPVAAQTAIPSQAAASPATSTALPTQQTAAPAEETAAQEVALPSQPAPTTKRPTSLIVALGVALAACIGLIVILLSSSKKEGDTTPASKAATASTAAPASAATQPAPDPLAPANANSTQPTTPATARAGARPRGAVPQPSPRATAVPPTSPSPQKLNPTSGPDCSDPNAYKTDSRCLPPTRTTPKPAGPDCSAPNAHKFDSRCRRK